jgi:hypothetical protein
VLAGGRSGTGAHGSDVVPWLYADDGASMIEHLEQLGVLAAEHDEQPGATR